MISFIHINNFALIDTLEVNFNNGFSTITGETGAGKSILLGALSLVTGARADLSVIKSSDKKAVVEVHFSLKQYKLENLFGSLDLDYEESTIVRREILPSGKSRAFVNDTPVRLDVLKELGVKLVDIHSQHQNLQIGETSFQFNLIDAFSNIDKIKEDYKLVLKDYNKKLKALNKLKTDQSDLKKEQDYNLFLLNELNEITLDGINLEEIEAEYDALNNSENIVELLSEIEGQIGDDTYGALNSINSIKSNFESLSKYSSSFESFYKRVIELSIELDDIYSEIDSKKGEFESNPTRLSELDTLQGKVNNLFQKHTVNSISDLIEIREKLNESVQFTENSDTLIAELETEILGLKQELDKLAKQIFDKRSKNIPDLVSKIESKLELLGMANAQLKFNLVHSDNYLSNGKDTLELLFQANKGGSFNEIKKVASGGEISRIMLVIKSLMAEYISLPTIIFDEIDTGVSGEISNKMADIMLKMSESMQVFTISHLPQVASKGNYQYKFYKEDINNVTTSSIIQLNEDERVKEIAQMLDGKNISSSALQHAKQLLN